MTHPYPSAKRRNLNLFSLKTLEGVLSIFALILILKFLIFGFFIPAIADEAVHIHEGYLASVGLRPDVDFYLQYHPLKVYLYGALLSMIKNPFLFIIIVRTLNLALLVFLAFMINLLYTRLTGLRSALPGLIFILGSSVSNFAMHNAQIKPDFLSLLFFVCAIILVQSYLTKKRIINLLLAALFVALSGMTSSKIIFPLIGLNLWLVYQNRKKGVLRLLLEPLILNLPLLVSFMIYISLTGGLSYYLYNHVVLVSGISPFSMGLKNLIIDSFKEAIQGPFMDLFILLTLYLLIFDRKRLFAANKKSLIILSLLLMAFQLMGNLIMNLRIGYLTPLLIPIALLIVPYLKRLDKRTEKTLISLAWLAFVFYLSWMGYIHFKILSHMFRPGDISSGYRTIFEQAKDYNCLNITSKDYYFDFYAYFFHPIFVRDAGYYYVASKIDRLENYENLTDSYLRKATLMVTPDKIRIMNPPYQVAASLDKYAQYTNASFEPVCEGMYMRRKPGQN